MEDASNQSEGLHGNAAYRTLLTEIREGRLLPGDRLRETELAERLNVSRTPIREAIRQLEADRLVTHIPRQGATIRRLDYAEIMELYEMRAVLEGTAAKLASRAASGIEIEELKSINEDLAEANKAEDAVRLNRIFHAALLDTAKNRFLHQSMNSLQKALMILGPTTLAENNRFESAVAEHRTILAAFETRDAAKAEASMQAHIEASLKTRMRALREAAFDT